VVPPGENAEIDSPPLDCGHKSAEALNGGTHADMLVCEFDTAHDLRHLYGVGHTVDLKVVVRWFPASAPQSSAMASSFQEPFKGLSCKVFIKSHANS
jgi:hypothetical protein